MYKSYHVRKDVVLLESNWAKYKKFIPVIFQYNRLKLSTINKNSRISKLWGNTLALGGGAKVIFAFLKSLFESPLIVYQIDSYIPANDCPTSLMIFNVSLNPAQEITQVSKSPTMQMILNQYSNGENMILVTHIGISYLTKDIIQLQVHGFHKNLNLLENKLIAEKINRLSNIQNLLNFYSDESDKIQPS